MSRIHTHSLTATCMLLSLSSVAQLTPVLPVPASIPGVTDGHSEEAVHPIHVQTINPPNHLYHTTVTAPRCFGFDTAVEEAQRALLAAKVEAGSARKGLGLVKLMGRQSGFIAMQASMASGALRHARPDVAAAPQWSHQGPKHTLLTVLISHALCSKRTDNPGCRGCLATSHCGPAAPAGVVDACLIPEVPFALHGENGLFAYLEKVMKAKGHCVLCVAEGAGQVGRAGRP